MSSPVSPALPRYQLKSDLALYCLPAANRDETRKLAWANSVCLMFLAIAAITLQQPVFIIREASPIPEPMPVVILPPQHEPETRQDTKEEEKPDEDLPPLLTEIPVVVPVTVAPPDAGNFSVPVEGFVAISTDISRVPPPPAIIPRPPPVDAPPPPPMFRNIRFGGREFRKQPPPSYPEEFSRNRIAGTVEALITIGTNGVPSQVEVGKSSGSPGLDRHVTEFIRREWRTVPGEIARYRIAITFAP